MTFNLLDHITVMCPDFQAGDKWSACRKMACMMAESKELSEEATEAITTALIARETHGSTAFGKGLAVPEARELPVPGVLVGLFLCKEGLAFEALDKAPVYILAPVVGNDDWEVRFECVIAIFQMLQNVGCRDQLLACKTANEMRSVLVSFYDPQVRETEPFPMPGGRE